MNVTCEAVNDGAAVAGSVAQHDERSTTQDEIPELLFSGDSSRVGLGWVTGGVAVDFGDGS